MRMIRRISSVAVALTLSLSAAVAGAQAAPGGFGSAGQFTIGAERLFGFVSSHQSTETETPNGTVTETDSISRFAFLGLHGPSIYTQPRVGLDYFVIDKLSVGGSLVVMTESGEHENETPGQATTTNDRPSTTAFIFAPRAGYALMFNDTIGFWPRGGFSYYNISTEDTNGGFTTEIDENGLALTLEALFIIAPIPHVGFTVGPTLDLGITGGREESRPAPQAAVERDRNITDLALQAGLVVWF
jgi:hypothetical protein